MFTISVNISMIIQREYHQEMMIRLLGDGLYQLYHILYYDIVNLLISSIMIVDNLSRDVLRLLVRILPSAFSLPAFMYSA